jgi:NADPH:quinone reductase-like Zn-dependent oxidoreductase
MIPGGDFAGTVVSEGDHVGQEVWGSGPALGMALGKARPGTHARFVVIPETWLSRKPERLSMQEAAAVGRSHWATWEAVIKMMEILPGETILITGGSGLVGQAAAAIARWRGAEAIIADVRKPEGCENFIDVNSSDLREAVLELTHGRGADLALDTVGGELFQPVVRSLRFDGRMVGFHGGTEPVEVDLADLYSRQIHVTGLASVLTTGPTLRASSINLVRCSTGASLWPPL